jgi:hypothetical protein
MFQWCKCNGPLGRNSGLVRANRFQKLNSTTFVGVKHLRIPSNLNFIIEANWTEYRSGYYEVQLNDWKTYRYLEPKFTLNPLDLFPGNTLMVQSRHSLWQRFALVDAS